MLPGLVRPAVSKKTSIPYTQNQGIKMITDLLEDINIWMYGAIALYILVGYYSFENMALTATPEETFFLRELSEGKTAARLVWLFYVLFWPILRIAAVLRHAIDGLRGALGNETIKR